MKVLSDSLLVLSDNWILVLTILFIILSGQMLIHLALKRIFGKELTAEEYFSLGIGGWLLPALLISLLWLVWGIIATQPPEVLIVFILIFTFAYSAILFFRSEKEVFSASKITLFVLFVILVLSLFLRLAFVSEAILPLYSDSAQHYRIIKDLLGNPESSNATASFKWPAPAYYHLGFHLLTAFITSLTNTEIAKTMLILGQMIIAVTPQ